MRIFGPNLLEIYLDADEIFDDAPDRGMPAQVRYQEGGQIVAVGGYWAAIERWAIQGIPPRGPRGLTLAEVNWLDKNSEVVEDFIMSHVSKDQETLLVD